MYWRYFYYIILSTYQYFQPVNASSERNCTPSYYAEDIDYHIAASSDFYFTSTGVKSVDECADFCFAREFCRTAVYNHFARTCSISYDWVLNCRTHPKRFTEYQSAEQRLVRITCIDGCGVNSTEIQYNNRIWLLNHLLMEVGIEITHNVKTMLHAPFDGSKVEIVTEPNIRWTTGNGNNDSMVQQPQSGATTTTVANNVDTTGISLRSSEATTTSTDVLIAEIKLPNRTTAEESENQISHQNVPEDDPTVTQAYDNTTTTTTAARTFDEDIANSESSIRILEAIARHARDDPNSYRVSVERTGEKHSNVIVRLADGRRPYKSHGGVTTAKEEVLDASDSPPTDSKPDHYVIHIKIPYSTVDSETSSELHPSRIPETSSSNQPKTQNSPPRTTGRNSGSLEASEEEQNFKKLPSRYISNQNGYLYHVRIYDLEGGSKLANSSRSSSSSSIPEHEIRRKESAELSSKNSTQCFRMINRQLLYNAAYKTLQNVSLEKCRCACAKTWDDDDECQMKCKSFQYSIATRNCILNEDDHMGNFDLVYNRNTDYYHTMCTGEDIIKSAYTCKAQNVVAGVPEATTPTEDWDLISRDWSKNEHSTKKRSTTDDPPGPVAVNDAKWSKIDSNEVNGKAVREDFGVSLAPIWNKVLKTKNAEKTLKNFFHKMPKANSPEISKTRRRGGAIDYDMEIQSTTARGIRESRSTKEEEESTQQQPQEQESPISSTTVSTESARTSDTLLSPPSHQGLGSITKAPYKDLEDIVEKKKSIGIKKGEDDYEKFVKPINNKFTLANKAEKITDVKDRRTTKVNSAESEEDEAFDGGHDDDNDENGLAVTSTIEGSGEMMPESLVTEEDFEIPEADSDEYEDYSGDGFSTIRYPAAKAPGGCFEVIDGYVMKSTAGGLEQDVTLGECQCYCANSRGHGRYAFQCTSATYYHKERDCVLNLQTRKERPEQFHKNVRSEYNVSYLGMICSVEESKRRLVDIGLTDGCRHKPITPSSPISSTTKKRSKIFDPKNTDICFLEMPNHLLQGTAFAAETDVSVEACKCYCVDAETRYGIVCHSMQYYFDSMTCLLNKESRNTDPESFNFAPAVTLMHSYFDFRCSTENNILSLYIEEVCSSVIDVMPKDEKFSTSRNFKFGNTNIKLFVDGTKNRNTSNGTTDLDLNILIAATNPALSTKDSRSQHTTVADKRLLHELGEEEEEETDDISESRDIRNTTMRSQTTPFLATARSSSQSTLDSGAHNDFPNFTTVVDSLSEPNATSISASTITDVNDDVSKSTTIATATTPSPTVTYPSTGPCIYSAIYQSAFRGAKLIKRILVSSPKQCFYGCHYEGCRSANLVQVDSQTNSCELYSDALIDYRTADILVYDSGSVYFDGIKCKKKRRKAADDDNDDNDVNNDDNL